MKTIRFILALQLIFFANTLSATHLAGSHFEYTYIDVNTYRIDLYVLRDCAGMDLVLELNLFRKSDCGAACEDIGPMTLNSSEYVDYGCGNTCEDWGNNPPGYQRFHFSKIVNLPSICDSWTFSIAINARNSVDFMVGDLDYYNYCRINNNFANNSPTITGSNLFLGCKDNVANAQYSFNPTDDDITIYDFVDPKNGDESTCDNWPVEYLSNYNALQTFPATSSFVLNNSTGGFAFTPTQVGTSYFAVRAREYRNGILIGETVIDGSIFVATCPISDHVTFGDFAISGNNSWTVSGTDEYCTTIILSSDNDLEVENVLVSGPNFVTSTVSNLSSGRKLVTMCVQFPPETLCQEMNIGVYISANTAGTNCLAVITSSGDEGFYYIKKAKGQYCPQNLYFTNRNPSGNIMPAYSRAEERIWVGDDMPVGAPFQTPGPVIANEHIEMVAGINVIIPACSGGGAQCVTLNAGSTIYLKPNSCSSECEMTPLTLMLDKEFNCSAETLIAVATGESPFSYQWNINGTIINTTSSSINVHEFFSEIDGSQIPYTCTVFDATGQSAQVSGSSWGTKRFYEPITNNKTWFDYPPNSIFGESGYYYSANLGVYTNMPAYITDSVNATPPWYGATGMHLIVYDRWGIPIVSHKVELEGSNDWSMDNGEFYWNGKDGNFPADGNNPWGDCYEGDLTDIFAYQLFNRNCYQLGSLDGFEIGIDEEATFTIFSCLDDVYEYEQTKSLSINSNEKETQVITGQSRIPDLSQNITQNEIFACFPLPASNEIEIRCSDQNLEFVRIIDQNGKTVLNLGSITSNQKINVKQLSPGIYILQATTDFGEKRTILIKE